MAGNLERYFHEMVQNYIHIKGHLRENVSIQITDVVKFGKQYDDKRI